ncbi:MAG: S1-like domain-containing RNA-binding protein [Planctomycetota bacterium]|nr:S1-like domain-containing RNA-binding protein [Planctomycetota bacterium]
MATFGKRNWLTVVKETNSGVYLDGGDLGEILLPGRYIPSDISENNLLDVFIYRDSEDRLVATTETPFAVVGEFACLKVKQLHENLGAFLDWGLAKDLLLPFREQGRPVGVGDWVVVYIGIDRATDRIFASASLDGHLQKTPAGYAEGEAVELLVTSQTPLGYNAIINNAHMGLLYHSNISTQLDVGQKIGGFVRTIRPDGKIDLSLDASGYSRIAPLTEIIIDELRSAGGRLRFDDDSSPDDIRLKFNASKKAFKQALGMLFRERRIVFTNPGIELIDRIKKGSGFNGEEGNHSR